MPLRTLNDRLLGRGTSLVLVVAFALGALALVALAPAGAADACGPHAVRLQGLSGPLVCAHSDEAPPGVDVTDHVGTAELARRTGAGLQAYRAAQDQGVPMAVRSTGTSPSVTCDGDGTSGYRVQAMYVVEASKPNRFASLLPSFKQWAAGTDDVINRSAALTGGVRHIRYVTEPGAGGTCEARVLNVTVPAGSMTSFNATISAVQALGYNDPTRKYLMWTDAATLCGIATLYPNDGASQGNPNNGFYAQYARVDSGCWGFGDGSTGHSVEAHELVHTLGAVNANAPHGTTAGHCWDEADTMCYADGGGHAMVQVCPPEREYLIDCNSDDYFSTYPDPGSYLASHWNAANSRFLVGGGDGTGGGQAGTPTHLGATIGVNNPAVPGLPTQAEVTPVLPTGRSVTSVAWTSKRTDCSFADPGQLQTTVTCNATGATATTVTAVLKDSSGETRTVTSPLTFATGTSRPVTVTTGVDSQAGATASVCTSSPFPVRATVTDTATGLPVKGLVATVTRSTATAPLPAYVGSAPTSATGVGVVTAATAVTADYAAKTPAGTVYAAAASAPVTATPSTCTSDLSGSASTGEVYYGEPVTYSGTLTRALDGGPVPVTGASLPVKVTWTDGAAVRTLPLGTAHTGLDGTWSLVARPTHSGAVSALLPASAGQVARTLDLGPLTVDLPDTGLSAAVDRTDVGYGEPVTVTGRLTRTSDALTTGAVTTGLGGASVLVKVQAPGATTAAVVGVARTLADGSFTAKVPLRVSGTLSVAYPGAAGQPAGLAVLGPVTSGTWTPAVTLSATRSATVVTLTGAVGRTYGAVTGAAPGVRVLVVFTPDSTGVPVVVSGTTTTATGTFIARHTSTAPGTYTAKVAGVAGYTDAASAPVVVP